MANTRQTPKYIPKKGVSMTTTPQTNEQPDRQRPTSHAAATSRHPPPADDDSGEEKRLTPRTKRSSPNKNSDTTTSKKKKNTKNTNEQLTPRTKSSSPNKNSDTTTSKKNKNTKNTNQQTMKKPNAMPKKGEQVEETKEKKKNKKRKIIENEEGTEFPDGKLTRVTTDLQDDQFHDPEPDDAESEVSKTPLKDRTTENAHNEADSDGQIELTEPSKGFETVETAQRESSPEYTRTTEDDLEKNIASEPLIVELAGQLAAKPARNPHASPSEMERDVQSVSSGEGLAALEAENAGPTSKHNSPFYMSEEERSLNSEQELEQERQEICTY
jgi:hypothetical protein